jgi:hypothetical protein
VFYCVIFMNNIGTGNGSGGGSGNGEKNYYLIVK